MVGFSKQQHFYITPGKSPYPSYRKLRGPQVRYGWVRKISHTPGFDSRNVHPLASRYTVWDIPSTQKRLIPYKFVARNLRAWLISRTQIITSVQLRSTVNCQSLPHCPPATVAWLVLIYLCTVAYWRPTELICWCLLLWMCGYNMLCLIAFLLISILFNFRGVSTI